MTYYEILEVKEGASKEVIKAAYKALAKKYHPDTFVGNVSERDRSMCKINEAYEILSNIEKKKAYDEQLKNKNVTFDLYKDYDNYEKQTNVVSKCDDINSKNEDDEKKKRSWLEGFLKDIGGEILSSLENRNREIENTYFEGISMNEYFLVEKFKKSSGGKRIGYAKALEEKGVLERDSNGKLVPTYSYRYLFR